MALAFAEGKDIPIFTVNFSIFRYKGAEKLEMGDKYQCTVTSTGEMCLEIADFSWSDIGEYKVYLENQYGSATQIVNMDMAGQYYHCCFFHFFTEMRRK